MSDPSSSNILGLFQLIGLWLIVVMITLVVLDWLFPRMRRGDDETPRFDAQPWYPTAPRLARRVVRPTEPVPLVNPAYWRSNVRLIVVLLIIWAGASFGPAVLAPLLNRISIFTGFPLGYYMGAQGSLVVFLGVITSYAWRAGRLDEKFRLPGQPPLSAF